MKNLSEELGRIINLLEDAVEEQNWKTVSKMIQELDELYEELDRQENGFYPDYE